MRQNDIVYSTEQDWQDSFNDADIFDGRDLLNTYTCRECSYRLFTIDRAKGVTPFLLRCKRDEGLPSQCEGWAESGMYRVAGGATPTHEWYRPTLEEVRAMDEPMREHCHAGGLLLRSLCADRHVVKNVRHQSRRECERRLRQADKVKV